MLPDEFRHVFLHVARCACPILERISKEVASMPAGRV